MRSWAACTEARVRGGQVDMSAIVIAIAIALEMSALISRLTSSSNNVSRRSCHRAEPGLKDGGVGYELGKVGGLQGTFLSIQ